MIYIMSKYIAFIMYLEKPEQLINWNEGTI
jgi:hypothetical protein